MTLYHDSYQLYKTAKGLNVIDPKTGKPAQTPQRFVNKQIVKNIREFTFRLEGDTPELRKAVEGGLNQLRTEFPDFRFNAQFGGT